jgi:hypothetical protein
MATANSFEAEPTPFDGAVNRHGFERVLGATRRKPALPGIPEDEHFRWRKNELIQPHAKA